MTSVSASVSEQVWQLLRHRRAGHRIVHWNGALVHVLVPRPRTRSARVRGPGRARFRTLTYPAAAYQRAVALERALRQVLNTPPEVPTHESA